MAIFHGTTRLVALFVVALALGAGTASAAVKLPRVLSQHMVLQREQPVRIWGWAKPGESVTVSFAGQNKTAITGVNGKWEIQLDQLRANKNPQELIIRGENELVIKDVLVGEVWVCSGQANMAFAVDRALNFEKEKASATNSAIRFFCQGDASEPLPQEDVFSGSWMVCEPAAVGSFSAVGYFFAREIASELDVPVGLLSCAAGGAVIEPWISAEGYRHLPASLSHLSMMVDETLPDTDLGRPHYQAYLAKLKEWLPIAEKAASAKQMIPLAPTPPWLSDSPELPTKQFNAKVQPLAHYAIRGVLWFQGEGNRFDGESNYFSKMQVLISGWRQAWGQGDFPFYFVQQANYKGTEPIQNNPAGGGGLADVRDAQRKILAIANTGMAVTIDLGETDDIRFKNKQDVGKRLALWALARDYQKPVVFSGPLYQRCQIEGNKIRIHFNHAQSGLIFGQKTGLEPVSEMKDGKPSCVAIAGKDKIFHWAKAAIEGQSVVAFSEKVNEPVAVRYAYTGDPQGVKLYNKEGLPASPFRSDDW